eukprot:5599356-Prymnesium_polylepis.1
MSERPDEPREGGGDDDDDDDDDDRATQQLVARWRRSVELAETTIETGPTIEDQLSMRWRIAELRSEIDSSKREISALKAKLGQNRQQRGALSGVVWAGK